MAYGMDDEGQTRTIGLARIGTGLVQGVALWALTEAADNKVWPATNGVLFGVLAAVVLFTPFLVLGGLADMRRRTLVVWTLAAAAGLAALGAHDIDRRAAHEVVEWISGQAMVFLAAVLFIAHHLVSAADSDRKLIARFPTYFDQAWKHGVQLVMSAGFVGVFWLVLFLGAALFKLIGIEFVEELTRKSWFAIPATTMMFAAAVQLTDVRHGLIRGIRTVALTLLSWLLPVLVFLAGAFMLALPFTGLEPLWKTRSAAGILLSSAAVLIVLINAAWQDGEPDGVAPLVLRLSTRLAAGLLGPLVGLAAYALWLRIGQYGLTPDRIAGAAACLVGAAYAVGYIAAAVRPGRWMRLIAPTNVTAAFLTLGVLLAIFTPLADPARLSVDSQMARLAEGKVTAARFDYDFLRWQSGRYGREALETLARRGGAAGRRAKAALAEENRWERAERLEPERAIPADPATVVVAWPAGRSLPPAFLGEGWLAGDAEALDCTTDKPCPAAMLDLNDDGDVEIIVAGPRQAAVFTHARWDDWWVIRQVTYEQCAGFVDAVRTGQVAGAVSPWKDLIVGGKRIALEERQNDCDPAQPPDRKVVQGRPPPTADGHSGRVAPLAR